MRFTKAQATGNDFVMLADPEGTLTITSEQVARLCDRHFGIGADGLIVSVPAHSSSDGADLLAEFELSSTDEAPLWFMDYRNSDGSKAEMCGNGVRAFAHFLLAEGLIEIQEGESFPVLTRAGLRTVRKTEEGFAVGMGVWSFIDPELAAETASDSLVQATGLNDPRPALSISMGNPHTVVALPDDDELDALDLTRAPQVEPVPPHGTNVEFVVPADPLVEGEVGHVSMRVHERGAGETLSCGTGTCAAAAAVRVWAGADAVDTWRVSIPGGEVTVRFTPRPDQAEDVELAGPSVLSFTGEITLEG